MNKAKNFINEYIYSSLKELMENSMIKDYKTVIQEYAQKEFEKTPHYKLLEES
jgi:dsRNA-specific ribonuclease